MKKIIWITHTPVKAVKKRLELSNFGTATWFENLLINLRKISDFEFHIISPYPVDDFEFIDDGIHYYVVKRSLKLRSSGDIDFLKQVKQLLSKISPDMIHIHGTETVGGLLGHHFGPLGIPVIVSIQGLSGMNFKALIGKFFSFQKHIYSSNLSFKGKIKWYYLETQYFLNMYLSGRRERKIVATNNNFFGRTAFDKAYINKYNPTALYFKDPRILRPAFYQDKKWNLHHIDRQSILLLNMRSASKGGEIAIRAVNILKDRYPGIKLRIGGSNESSFYGQYLLNLAKKLGVFEQVSLLGFLDDERTRDNLLKAHVFCLTSLTENSPNTLAEAQITGLPCVAHLIMGVPSYIEDNCSLTFKDSKVSDLAEKIAMIFDNDDLASRLGDKAFEVARRRHDIPNAVETIEYAYRKLMKEN